MKLYDNIVGEIIECLNKDVLLKEAKRRIWYYETKGLGHYRRFNHNEKAQCELIVKENKIVINRKEGS